MHAKFKGSCLKQDKPAFNHGKIVNIYVVYDLESNLNNFDPALENCLFGAVKLTKNSDIDKYKYTGYGIGFDSKGSFLFPDGSFGQNVIMITKFFILSYVNPLKCISMNNQECKARPKIIDVNNNVPVFYSYSNKVNKCSGSCNNIIDLYAKLCVPDIIKNINVKVFNLMSRINETRQIIWHEACKCVCRLTSVVCYTRQIWNEDKCRCECKEDLKLTKWRVIKDIFGILAIALVNVINHVV